MNKIIILDERDVSEWDKTVFRSKLCYIEILRFPMIEKFTEIVGSANPEARPYYYAAYFTDDLEKQDGPGWISSYKRSSPPHAQLNNSRILYKVYFAVPNPIRAHLPSEIPEGNHCNVFGINSKEVPWLRLINEKGIELDIWAGINPVELLLTINEFSL